jgi:hypothetical protein
MSRWRFFSKVFSCRHLSLAANSIIAEFTSGKCAFASKVDTDSQGSWTPIRIQRGHFLPGMRNSVLVHANPSQYRFGGHPGVACRAQRACSTQARSVQLAPEWVSSLDRNHCPVCTGIGVQFGPVRAAGERGQVMSPANCARLRLAPFAGLEGKEFGDPPVARRRFKLSLESFRRKVDKCSRRW